MDPKLTNREVNELIDKLLVQIFYLIEQKVKCTVNAETAINAGNLLIAKARYIQGSHTVTKAQLPTENSTEFDAILTVNRTGDNLINESYTDPEPDLLQHPKRVLIRHPIDRKNGLVDPINWFGVLVPQSLHLAKERFQTATELLIECANVQTELTNTMSSLEMLLDYKEKMGIEEVKG